MQLRVYVLAIDIVSSVTFRSLLVYLCNKDASVLTNPCPGLRLNVSEK